LYLVPGRNFRGKPSDAHIIWTRAAAKRRRFDTDRFEQWASHYGFTVEREQRVDHERGAEKRTQYRCVFSWTSTDGERIEFGDEEWELGTQKTPETFVEIDSKAMARIKDWDREYIVKIDTMVHDGDKLLIETADGETHQLQSEKLADRDQ
jgi:hypothetical protein